MIGNFESSRAARVPIEGRQETAGNLRVLPPIDFSAKVFQLSFERGLADIKRPSAPGTVASNAPPIATRLERLPEDVRCSFGPNALSRRAGGLEQPRQPCPAASRESPREDSDAGATIVGRTMSVEKEPVAGRDLG